MSPWERQLSNAERRFFEQLFARLESASIATLLLRNYEKFPASMGHDLDVFFRRADVPRSVEVFRDLLREGGGEVLHVHERDYVLAVWFRAAPGEPQPIHLDFYHGAYTWHSLPYIGEAELLAGRRASGNFQTARPVHEALNLFLTSVLWGGFYKVRYAPRIASLLAAPPEAGEFFRVLDREFGAGSRPPFDFMGETASKDDAPPGARTALSARTPPPPPADMAVRAPAGEDRRDYSRRLRRALKVRSLLHRPFSSAFRLGRYWLKELGTVLAPPGICLAILGPDGSGKSTVIRAVKERIEYYFGEVEDRHWRPHFLRDVGVLLGRREKASGPVSDPHGRPPHSRAVSALRFFYYWLDYWLGWPLRVWKFRAKNHLVIFDRFAQDMWCDPKRYRLGLPRGLMKFFCRLVPQPELTFVLLADAETIHRRKGEVPLETLRELLQHYGEAAQQGRRVRAVDCSRPVDQIADEIAAAVMAHLQAKTKKDRRFR